MDNLESQKSPFRRLQVAISKYVCRSPFCPARFYNPWFTVTGRVPEPRVATPDFSFAKKQSFLAPGSTRFRWTPVRTHARTDTRTDNYNFSIMMV